MLTLETLPRGNNELLPNYQLTFSPDKSFSVAYSAASPARKRQIEYAHDKAVFAALDYNSCLSNKCDSILRHNLNRDLEPQVHSHCVISSMTVTQQRELYQRRKEADAKYHAELADNLKGLDS